jgi:hypothetical protein
MSYFDLIKCVPIEKVNIKKSFGNSPDDIVGTDITVSFILNLLQNKSGNKRSAVTESITIIASFDEKTPLSPSDLLSIETVSTILVNTYKAINSENVGVIYSALNAGSHNGGSSHQNWLCLDFDSKTLLRFEPSDDFLEFRISEFCNLIITKLNEFTPSGSPKWTYVVPFKYFLNTFCACRVFSTLLVSMYIDKIPFEYLDKFLDKNGYGKEIYTKPLVYLLQNEYLSIAQKSSSSIKCNRVSRTKKVTIYGYLII